MNNSHCYFAVDLGATSGRTIVGTIVDGKVELEELTRFPNNLIETGGHFYWDIYALYFEIIKGLKLAAKRGLEIESIGIDTWGVDFVCVGNDGALLRNPISYRDPYTFGVPEEYFANAVSKEDVYRATGRIMLRPQRLALTGYGRTGYSLKAAAVNVLGLRLTCKIFKLLKR